MIDVDAFQFLAKRPEMQIFLLSILPISKALNIKHFGSGIQIALDRKPIINLLTKHLPQYQVYADVFLVAVSNKIPLYKSYYYKIQPELEKNLDHGPIKGMTRDEPLVLKKYSECNFCRRFIFCCFSSFICEKTRRRVKILR